MNHETINDWPHASWDDVVAAVCDASNNAEGRTSAAYLEYHFQKAGLVVLYHVDMPKYLQAQGVTTVGVTAADISDLGSAAAICDGEGYDLLATRLRDLGTRLQSTGGAK